MSQMNDLQRIFLILINSLKLNQFYFVKIEIDLLREIPLFWILTVNLNLKMLSGLLLKLKNQFCLSETMHLD